MNLVNFRSVLLRDVWIHRQVASTGCGRLVVSHGSLSGRPRNTHSTALFSPRKTLAKHSSRRISSTAKTAPATPSPSTVHQPSSYAYVRELARRTTPTLLFEAPSHHWLFFGSWTSGIFCYSYAGYHFATTYLHPPEGLGWWVPKAFGVISVAMACVGTFFILRSSNVIHTIRAIPPNASSTTSAAGRAATKLHPTGYRSPPAGGTKVPPLLLEISVKRLLPFQSCKVYLVPQSQVSIESRMDSSQLAPVPSPAALTTELDRIEQRQREEKAAEERRQYEMKHLYTLPFRHAAQGIVSLFQGVRQALTGGGFAMLQIEGAPTTSQNPTANATSIAQVRPGTTQNFKLDVESGWMLNDGQVLGRIVKLKAPGQNSHLLRLYNE